MFRGACPGRPLSLPLLADRERADELHLREVGHRVAHEVTPGSPVGGRVDEDRRAGLDEERGHVAQSPVDDLALAIRVARSRRDALPDLIELETHDRPPEGSKLRLHPRAIADFPLPGGPVIQMAQLMRRRRAAPARRPG